MGEEAYPQLRCRGARSLRVRRRHPARLARARLRAPSPAGTHRADLALGRGRLRRAHHRLSPPDPPPGAGHHPVDSPWSRPVGGACVDVARGGSAPAEGRRRRGHRRRHRHCCRLTPVCLQREQRPPRRGHLHERPGRPALLDGLAAERRWPGAVRRALRLPDRPAVVGRGGAEATNASLEHAFNGLLVAIAGARRTGGARRPRRARAAAAGRGGVADGAAIPGAPRSSRRAPSRRRRWRSSCWPSRSASASLGGRVRRPAAPRRAISAR